MSESNCCGASPLWETDICSDCREHAEFYNIDKEQGVVDITAVGYKKHNKLFIRGKEVKI